MDLNGRGNGERGEESGGENTLPQHKWRKNAQRKQRRRAREITSEKDLDDCWVEKNADTHAPNTTKNQQQNKA